MKKYERKFTESQSVIVASAKDTMEKISSLINDQKNAWEENLI